MEGVFCVSSQVRSVQSKEGEHVHGWFLKQIQVGEQFWFTKYHDFTQHYPCSLELLCFLTNFWHGIHHLTWGICFVYVRTLGVVANLKVARTCFEYDTINRPLAVYFHDAREKLRDFCEAFLDAHWIACKVRVETPEGGYRYLFLASVWKLCRFSPKKPTNFGRCCRHFGRSAVMMTTVLMVAQSCHMFFLCEDPPSTNYFCSDWTAIHPNHGLKYHPFYTWSYKWLKLRTIQFNVGIFWMDLTIIKFDLRKGNQPFA